MDQTLERGAHKEMYAGKSGRTDGRTSRNPLPKKNSSTEMADSAPSQSVSVVFSSLGEIIPQKSWLSHIPFHRDDHNDLPFHSGRGSHVVHSSDAVASDACGVLSNSIFRNLSRDLP